MVGAKLTSFPMIFSKKLTSQDGSLLIDPRKYRMIVGALQYCIICRPDISYIVNQLCKFMHSPREDHWTNLKCIVFITQSRS